MKQFYLTCIVFFLIGILGKAQIISQPSAKKFNEMTAAESHFYSRFKTDSSDSNSTQFNEIRSNSFKSTLGRNYYIEFPYQGVSRPMQSVTDSEGNTYITGTSSHEEAPVGNMLTIKFDPQGEIEWMVREDVADFASEFGFAISLDAENNPVVAGVKWNGSNMDVRTVKYDKNSGASIWESIFDGGYSGLDYPSQITVDNQGNVLVLGMSYTNENGSESVNYTTIKYNSEGNLLWSKIDLHDIEGVWIEPSAISIDDKGNIAVVGYGSDENFFQTYYTIKYSAAGELLWKQKYSFQMDGNQTNSVANDVAFDNEGNAYVTGTLASAEVYSKIGTVKYAPDGTQLWVNEYETPEHRNYGYQIKIDQDKIYVAGMHRSNGLVSGLNLISYAPDGTENWAKETTDLEILGSGLGSYVHLELDSQKNPVVGVRGQNEEWKHTVKIAKYDTSGELIHEKNYVKELTGIFTIDGLIGIGINANDDYTIVMDNRYTEEGNVYEITKIAAESTVPDWNNFYGNMGGSITEMQDAFADELGNTIISGKYGQITEDVSYMQNFFIAKYDEQGEVLWQHSFNPENGNPANTIRIKVNSQGETIVVLSASYFESLPVLIKKYSPSGELVWEIEKPLIQGDINDLLIDDNDNIYVSGNAHESEEEYSPRFAVIKMDNDGNEMWTKLISSGNENDNSYYITKSVSDASGNVTFTGNTGVSSMMSQSLNLTTFQISADGELNWMNTKTLPNWNSGGNDLFVNELGEVYTAGWKENRNQMNQGDVMILKYDSNGEIIWEENYVQNGRRLRPYSIIPLSNGEMVVTTFSVIDGLNNRVVALKYNQEGILQWEKNSEFNEFYRDTYVDDMDNLYILKQIYSTTHPHRIYFNLGAFTIAGLTKISADGEVEDEIFVAPNLSSSNPERLVPVNDGRLLLGNTISSEISHFSGISFFTSTHEVLGADDSDLISDRNKLGQNYPNPATSQTEIPFHITESGKVNIKLYDSTGRYLRELTHQYFPKGENSISVNLNGLAKGIYFYQMNVNGFKQARKLIVK